jgi:hypothetical protein
VGITGGYMEIINIAPQLSQQYQSGWSHLEQWGDSFSVKLLKWKNCNAPENESYEGYSKITRAIAPQGVSDQLVVQALHDSLGGATCRHEHDCCGCKIYHTQVKKLRHRTWLVKLNVSYNV